MGMIGNVLFFVEKFLKFDGLSSFVDICVLVAIWVLVGSNDFGLMRRAQASNDLFTACVRRCNLRNRQISGVHSCSSFSTFMTQNGCVE